MTDIEILQEALAQKNRDLIISQRQCEGLGRQYGRMQNALDAASRRERDLDLEIRRLRQQLSQAHARLDSLGIDPNLV